MNYEIIMIRNQKEAAITVLMQIANLKVMRIMNMFSGKDIHGCFLMAPGVGIN